MASLHVVLSILIVISTTCMLASLGFLADKDKKSTGTLTRKKGLLIFGVITAILLALVNLTAPNPNSSLDKVSTNKPSQAQEDSSSIPNSTSSPQNSTSPSVRPQSAPASTQESSQQDSELCKATGDNGGVFYLNVTSATEHNFSACAGNEVLATDTDVFTLDPTMDRRCLNSNNDVSSSHAIIGVYSGSSSADLSAATDYCSNNGWSND